jgi:hypothetical protein
MKHCNDNKSFHLMNLCNIFYRFMITKMAQEIFFFNHTEMSYTCLEPSTFPYFSENQENHHFSILNVK